MSTPTPETTPLTTADPPADPGAFQSSLGLVIDSTTATRVLGHIDFGPQHHSHLGTVFGGAFASIIESAPATGARLAAGQNGADVVGVQNTTDFLRPFTRGRATVEATALHQGRTQQLWQVVIAAEDSGKVLARGQLRLQNVHPAERPRPVSGQ